MNTFTQTLSDIRRNNYRFGVIQSGGKFITVRNESTEYKLGDYCIDENGHIEDMEWTCQHRNTGNDYIDQYTGRLTTTNIVTYCDDCNAVYNEWENEWEHER